MSTKAEQAARCHSILDETMELGREISQWHTRIQALGPAFAPATLEERKERQEQEREIRGEIILIQSVYDRAREEFGILGDLLAPDAHRLRIDWIPVMRQITNWNFGTNFEDAKVQTKMLAAVLRPQTLTYQDLDREGKVFSPAELGTDRLLTSAIRPIADAPKENETRSRKTIEDIAEAPTISSEPIPPDYHEEILQALLELKAFDRKSRKSTAEVCKRTLGPDADPALLKRPITALRKQGDVLTKGGKGGGVWLTSAGRDKAVEIVKREQTEHKATNGTS